MKDAHNKCCKECACSKEACFSNPDPRHCERPNCRCHATPEPAKTESEIDDTLHRIIIGVGIGETDYNTAMTEFKNLLLSHRSSIIDEVVKMVKAIPTETAVNPDKVDRALYESYIAGQERMRDTLIRKLREV